MEHSVTFGDKHTWHDWHLIPSTKPVIAMPAVRSKWVEIPGVDGQIELNRRIYGIPRYENREGTLEFIISDYAERPWAEVYAEMAAHFHGRAMTMVLDDDPLYYYEGVFTLEYKGGANYSTVSIGYTLNPFKYPKDADFAKWDPLDYELSHAGEMTSATVNGTKNVSINVKRLYVEPVFYCTGEMSVKSGSNTAKLSKGLTRNTGLVLAKGAQTLTLTGNGKIQIDYRGGTL